MTENITTVHDIEQKIKVPRNILKLKLEEKSHALLSKVDTQKAEFEKQKENLQAKLEELHKEKHSLFTELKDLLKTEDQSGKPELNSAESDSGTLESIQVNGDVGLKRAVSLSPTNTEFPNKKR